MFCRRRLQRCFLEVQRGGFLPSQKASGRILICRTQLTANGRTRPMSTMEPKDDLSFGEGSIFSKKENAWAHIFDDDPDLSPWASKKVKQPRRQTMNETEKNVIRNLLDELYQAKQQRDPEALAKVKALRESISSEKTPKHHYRQTALEKDPQVVTKLDEMRQAIEDCPTKIELYQWAQANVFTLLALDKPSHSKQATPTPEDQHLFQTLTPVLIRHFRDRFKDPNLSLFIFKAVRSHSAMSYVLGCTAPTYNELMITLWDSFRDLQGVRDALEDMHRSDVEATSHTQALAERVCREAMDDKLWLDHTEEGEQVAIATISRVSDLLIELMASKSNKQGEWGRRRRDVMTRRGGGGELDFEERMQDTVLPM
ncbi:hypothetical protein FA13DRAFT_1770965 [Coprinellus micaceus]|uniref:Mtf2-like C-terminal domain-containing protein n=1 Tax=Coprinellus micaceus TaxID=71717 RepID=A0A4Y7TTI3_COPMI|nr:hypothetical protein FA13DRAFT_1770965 [Coprinellus micaceus]